MEYFPPALEALTEQFARLPGVGKKSAQRLAFFVLGLPDEEARAFAEAIVTANEDAARRFTAMVDSAAVYWNASTRFTDGGVFGLGCEMGISTQKLHARGPMGLEELCSYKYVITGNGQIR